ncbi:hypothetical protein M569_12220, partial [Genlisea aurea]
PTLGRQPSIYSLTLDEFQHTLNESGKNFGSMNMDEFLNSIWTAEENQSHGGASQIDDGGTANQQPPPPPPHGNLARQGSLTLPEQLCRKTVDEVWSDIHRNLQNEGENRTQVHHPHNAGGARKQPTFGEMTLEDFLVRAGVVREQNPPPPQTQFGMYQPISRPIIYPYLAQEAQPYAGNGSPVSPASSDGPNPNQIDGGNQFGSRGGRKRVLDGPVEKVVERRQRRMIKNRESAARSRARKQAYTVELEAELNQLKEENAHLKQALVNLRK